MDASPKDQDLPLWRECFRPSHRTPRPATPVPRVPIPGLRRREPQVPESTQAGSQAAHAPVARQGSQRGVYWRVPVLKASKISLLYKEKLLCIDMYLLTFSCYSKFQIFLCLYAALINVNTIIMVIWSLKLLTFGNHCALCIC